MHVDLMSEIIFLGNLQSGHLLDITEVLRLEINELLVTLFCQVSTGARATPLPPK